MSKRYLKESKYHSLYKKLHEYKLYKCFYCGVPASTEDHVSPLAYVDTIGTDTVVRFGIKLWLVEACHECNCILGAKPLVDPLERKEFIKKGLQKRYKKILSAKDYTEEELQEFGYTLRENIKQGLDLKQQILKRVAY